MTRREVEQCRDEILLRSHPVSFRRPAPRDNGPAAVLQPPRPDGVRSFRSRRGRSGEVAWACWASVADRAPWARGWAGAAGTLVPVTHGTLALAAAPSRRAAAAVGQLLRFGWLQVQCCLFAAAIFAGLAASSVVPLPIARYDALVLYGLAVTVVFYLLRLETWREVAVIGAFHLIGLALEVYKVNAGSWSYPEDAWAMIGGVPLYSGFMYAAVGSYLCQAFRRFDLRVTNFRWVPAVLLAVAVYANFYTHHVLPDVRWLIAAGFVVALWRSRVFYTVGSRRYAMPLTVSFVLIGFFLWVAENAATFLGAWQYPDQAEIWRMVHTGKWGSWALLVSLSFVLVAAVKAREGRFYGAAGAQPQVELARLDERAG
ncbi:DUF817 domain-containing protein [Ruania sp. N2-46]|uniref:DUF817 domain-containing protein n=1 Tax=Occultella gossypii TaxID=2800820 RepID=A0ABS7SE95_9MICO|nr:DUF817 domain-containing protein [Occultella gossypii]